MGRGNPLRPRILPKPTNFRRCSALRTSYPRIPRTGRFPFSRKGNRGASCSTFGTLSRGNTWCEARCLLNKVNRHLLLPLLLNYDFQPFFDC